MFSLIVLMRIHFNRILSIFLSNRIFPFVPFRFIVHSVRTSVCVLFPFVMDFLSSCSYVYILFMWSHHLNKYLERSCSVFKWSFFLYLIRFCFFAVLLNALCEFALRIVLVCVCVCVCLCYVLVEFFLFYPEVKEKRINSSSKSNLAEMAALTFI